MSDFYAAVYVHFFFQELCWRFYFTLNVLNKNALLSRFSSALVQGARAAEGGRVTGDQEANE